MAQPIESNFIDKNELRADFMVVYSRTALKSLLLCESLCVSQISRNRLFQISFYFVTLFSLLRYYSNEAKKKEQNKKKGRFQIKSSISQ